MLTFQIWIEEKYEYGHKHVAKIHYTRLQLIITLVGYTSFIFFIKEIYFEDGTVQDDIEQ